MDDIYARAIRFYRNNPARITIDYGPFNEIDIYIDPHAENIYQFPPMVPNGNPSFIGSMQSWGAMMAMMLASAYKPEWVSTICPFAMDDGAC